MAGADFFGCLNVTGCVRQCHLTKAVIKPIDRERARVAKLESENHYLRALLAKHKIKFEPKEQLYRAQSKPVGAVSKEI